MGPKIVLITLVIYTVIIQTKSVTNGSHCDNCSPQEYTRIKRAKYYGPQKFYRRPPTNYPTKGAFSYTPPPGYMDDEDKHPSFRPKVSKKRTTDGLGDEDINNLVKYLTKKDLDKIIEFAGEKGKYSDREHEMEYRQTYKRPEYNGQDENGEKFSLNGPYINEPKNTQRYAFRDHPNVQHQGNPNLNYINDATQPRILNSNPQDVLNPGPVGYQNEAPNPRIIYSNPPGIPPLQTPGQISFLNQNAEGSIFTDSSVMKEETLPKPSNLRDDYEISYTNNVEKVVKSESSSYKVEDFGELPLMNYYDSKLHSVSSYNVPHYTITSPRPPPPARPSPSSSSSQVPLELAPAGATGKDQSDAHLKAIRIWTHKSKGTAYTLHDDGTLSLEKPKYGP